MRDKYILTAESVTEGHPDKLCDTIADSVLDACLKGDSSAHVACEVLATAGKVLVAGEISAKIMPDIPSIVCRTIREAGYTGLDYEIEVIITLCGKESRPGLATRGSCMALPVMRQNPIFLCR